MGTEGDKQVVLLIDCNVLYPMFTKRFWPDKLHSTQNLFAIGIVMGPFSMYPKNFRAYSSRKMPNLLHKRNPGADAQLNRDEGAGGGGSLPPSQLWSRVGVAPQLFARIGDRILRPCRKYVESKFKNCFPTH